MDSDSTETSCVGFGTALESGLAGRAGIRILRPVQEDAAAWKEATALKLGALPGVLYTAQRQWIDFNA